MLELLFILIIASVISLSAYLIFNSFRKSENYYEYSKTEKEAKCNYEDYAFISRKMGR